MKSLPSNGRHLLTSWDKLGSVSNCKLESVRTDFETALILALIVVTGILVTTQADLEMWDGSKSEVFVLKIKCKAPLRSKPLGEQPQP